MEFLILLKRELKLAYNNSFELLNMVIFFVIISFVFAFAMEGHIYFKTAVAVILICFLLALNISSRFIFKKDISSGMLQQLFLSLKSLNNLVLAKILAQFLSFGVPLSLSTLIIAIFFNLSFENIFLLLKIILPLGFIVSISAVMIASITSGLKSGQVIAVTLSLPLYMPVIITSLAATNIKQLAYVDYLVSLSGFALITIPLCIFAFRQTIRNSIS